LPSSPLCSCSPRVRAIPTARCKQEAWWRSGDLTPYVHTEYVPAEMAHRDMPEAASHVTRVPSRNSMEMGCRIYVLRTSTLPFRTFVHRQAGCIAYALGHLGVDTGRCGSQRKRKPLREPCSFVDALPRLSRDLPASKDTAEFIQLGNGRGEDGETTSS
jgi:hypothetical protein